MKTDKSNVLKLLKRKRDGTLRKSYKELALETGYSKNHLKKLSAQLKESSIEELSVHKNTGNASHNAACNPEVEYIVKFKELYPVISVAQFKDVYEEDVVTDKVHEKDVRKYGLKIRSYGFYLNLFHRMKWVSPVKRRSKKAKDKERLHLLRKPSERKGHLIQIDGTPFDWFNDGRMYTLHLAIDDATSEILSGWFTPHECLYGYCQMMCLLLKKHGIPTYVYSDRHTILKGPSDGETVFSLMLKRIGIDQIYALSAQAKGRIERANGTVQRRLPVDIIRFHIRDYDELNVWFNDCYIGYLNKKFSFLPLDPNCEFEEIIDKSFDYNRVFSVEYERKMMADSMFYFEGHIYNIADINTGEVLYIRKGVKIKLIFEILTRKLYVIYYSKRYLCVDLGETSKYRRREKQAGSTKELNEILRDLDKKK